jgi:hypothetical protein
MRRSQSVGRVVGWCRPSRPAPNPEACADADVGASAGALSVASPYRSREYEKVGGLHWALTEHLDATFSSLSQAQQEIAEKMFKCLCQQDANNNSIRRPTRLAEICAVTQTDQESVIEVIDTFRRPSRSFLMHLDQPLSADAVIDISLESPIRNWRHLRDWASKEAEAANMYRRIAQSVGRIFRRGTPGPAPASTE